MGRRLLSQVSFSIPSDANVEGSKLICRKPRGVRKARAWITSSTIFSLIGLADEKEYPVAKNTNPMVRILIWYGNGDIIQITDIGLSLIVKAGCV